VRPLEIDEKGHNQTSRRGPERAKSSTVPISTNAVNLKD
jgi:hypothetical protein